MNRFTQIILLLTLILGLTSCSNVSIPLPFVSTPTPSTTMAYDAPVTLTIKTGKTLPGTNIAYGGKTDTGAAKVLIGGLVAPKQVLDGINWEGSPAPNVNVRLNTRVATFDEQSITLGGTAHIEILGVKLQAGGATPTTNVMEFSAPVTFSLKKDEAIPGSLLIYAGSTPNGAQFLGLEGYPYRNALDSLQYVGRLNAKVYLRLDLRVVSFTESGVVVGGTANLRIEQ